MLEFILETNGLLLGHESGFAQRLSQFERLAVRVALKGFDEESFEVISGTERGFFAILLKGLGDLIANGINAWPAIMYETFGPGGIGEINRRLKEYGIGLEELEIEYLEPHGFVLENLKKRSISLHP